MEESQTEKEPRKVSCGHWRKGASVWESDSHPREPFSGSHGLAVTLLPLNPFLQITVTVVSAHHL